MGKSSTTWKAPEPEIWFGENPVTGDTEVLVKVSKVLFKTEQEWVDFAVTNILHLIYALQTLGKDEYTPKDKDHKWLLKLYRMRKRFELLKTCPVPECLNGYLCEQESTGRVTKKTNIRCYICNQDE